MYLLSRSFGRVFWLGLILAASALQVTCNVKPGDFHLPGRISQCHWFSIVYS